MNNLPYLSIHNSAWEQLSIFSCKNLILEEGNVNQSCNPSKNLFNSLFIHESGLIQANTICTAVYGSSDMKRLVGDLK